ncbi:uncharacterized protein LOC101862704 [Aplysia californica]|uniref:Uncharacterized protein LOC101862704 n=1 Tax=Aplysia californica TaxID=6500 RepID=A0ABM1AET3_APLCA|nr:uncharacterized protein LOC101862704 [Aplysia californica]
MGCCDSDGPVNFSMLRMPDIVAVDFSSPWFWGPAILMYCGPFVKPCVCVWEHRGYHLRRLLGDTGMMRAVAMLTLLAHLATVFSFYHGTGHHPQAELLRSNEVLVVGYVHLFCCLWFLVQAYSSYGWRAVLGGEYLNVSRRSKPEARCEPYYHPSGSGWVLGFVGFSLTHASLAGFLFAMVLAVAHFLAFRLERSALQAPKEKSVRSVGGGGGGGGGMLETFWTYFSKGTKQAKRGRRN